MKKRSVYILIIAILTLVLGICFTACTGGMGGISSFSYSLEITPKVQSVPTDADIDEDYIKEIISVSIKYKDGHTTHVNFEDCTITYSVNKAGDKLEIKVKFGKKSAKITLDIADVEEQDACSLYVFQDAKIEDGMTDAEIKAALIVRVGCEGWEDDVILTADQYDMKMEKSADGKRATITVTTHDNDGLTESVEVEFGFNPALTFEGVENLYPGVTAEEAKELLDLYLESGGADAPVLLDKADYTISVTVDEYNNTIIYAYTKDYGFATTSFTNEKYVAVIVKFDESKWKDNMTNDEIIAALSFSQFDGEEEVPFEITGTLTLERIGGGMVQVLMDGEKVGAPVFVNCD